MIHMSLIVVAVPAASPEIWSVLLKVGSKYLVVEGKRRENSVFGNIVAVVWKMGHEW